MEATHVPGAPSWMAVKVCLFSRAAEPVGDDQVDRPTLTVVKRRPGNVPLKEGQQAGDQDNYRVTSFISRLPAATTVASKAESLGVRGEQGAVWPVVYFQLAVGFRPRLAYSRRTMLISVW